MCCGKQTRRLAGQVLSDQMQTISEGDYDSLLIVSSDNDQEQKSAQRNSQSVVRDFLYQAHYIHVAGTRGFSKNERVE